MYMYIAVIIFINKYFANIATLRLLSFTYLAYTYKSQ